jgi:acyl carrier protein
MDELKNKLKAQIIEALNLEDIEVSDINDSEPLFGDGLGLDSIDALELIVLLEREYGLKMDDASQGKTVLQSVDSMAAYIQSKQ